MGDTGPQATPQGKGWPPGQQMLPQGFIDESKRERCASVIAELVHEQGVEAVSTAKIISCSRIGRPTFYELFGDTGLALRFACNWADARLARAIEEGAGEGGSWELRVIGAIESLLRAARKQTAEVELCLVHRARLVGVPSGPGEEASAAALTAVLGRGHPGWNHEHDAFAAVDELVAGAILAVVANRLRKGKVKSLARVRDELVELALASAGAATDPAAPRACSRPGP